MSPVYVILSALVISLGQVIQAIKVYEFETTVEENSKLIIENAIPAPEAFTLCMDFYFLLETSVSLMKSKNPEDLDIQIRGKFSHLIHVRVAGIWYLAIPYQISLYTWYSLCLSYDFKTQAFILALNNMILVEEEKKFPNRDLSKDFLSYLSIGERDGSFHLAGEVSRVNIWSKALDKEKLRDITNCDDSSSKEIPDVHNWENIDATIEGGVVEKELSDYPCKSGTNKFTQVLMAEPATSMFDAVKTCDLLGGSLSFPSNKEEVIPFLDNTRFMQPDSRCKSYIWSNFYKNSNADNNWTIYWSETTYKFPPFQYPGWLAWAPGQPNGGKKWSDAFVNKRNQVWKNEEEEKCAGINIVKKNNHLDDLACEDTGYCFMCR